VTPRALLTALLLLLLLLPLSFMVSIVWNDEGLTNGVPGPAQVSLLFLLTALLGLPALHRFGLTRRELLTVYVLLSVAAPVMSSGIIYYALPKVITFFYLARSRPEFESGLLPYVPTWFAPTETNAVEGFFNGHAPVPWALWWTPLAVWLSFTTALFTGVSCLLSLLQRQWIGHERLAFPIAQVPLEMVAEGDAVGSPARLSHRLPFLLGTGLAFTLTFLSALQKRVPSLPALPLGPVTIIPWQGVGPLAGLGAFDLVLWPWLIALAYLIPKELSFSCWFFWLVRLALTVGAIAWGASPQRPEEWWDATFPAPTYQGTGALLALGIWSLWTGRRHLRHALRAAVRGSESNPAEEPMSYRAAVLGFVLSLSVLVYLCWCAGCRPLAGALVIVTFFAYCLMWARLRAETGLGFLAFPVDPTSVLRTPLGSAVWRPREIVTMVSMRWVTASGEGMSLDTTTANLLDGFKVADAAGISKRRLMVAAGAAFLLAWVIGLPLALAGTYHFGYLATKVGAAPYYPALQTRWDATNVFETLRSPALPNQASVIGLLAGGAVAVLLGAMRLRFAWWPFHPIGYLASNCWGWNWYSVPFFVGWVAKSLVVRYGGLRLYRLTLPLAVGLIVGSMLNQALWVLLTLFTQGKV
jgi:hypothetical protein